jgi:hypothetical protein
MERANRQNLFLAPFSKVGYIKTPLARPNLYPFSIKAFYIPIKPKQKNNTTTKME